MASFEKYRQKESDYEFYGFLTSNIKSEIKVCLKDLINLGIDDCCKKLLRQYSSDGVSEKMEKMKTSYLNAVRNNSTAIDTVVDKVFNLPHGQIEHNSDGEISASKMDEELNELKMKILAMNQYHSELLKMEAELHEKEIPDFSEQSDLTVKIEATSKQRLDEMKLMADLFSKTSSSETGDLENSVMNMSLG